MRKVSPRKKSAPGCPLLCASAAINVQLLKYLCPPVCFTYSSWVSAAFRRHSSCTTIYSSFGFPSRSEPVQNAAVWTPRRRANEWEVEGLLYRSQPDISCQMKWSQRTVTFSSLLSRSEQLVNRLLFWSEFRSQVMVNQTFLNICQKLEVTVRNTKPKKTKKEGYITLSLCVKEPYWLCKDHSIMLVSYQIFIPDGFPLKTTNWIKIIRSGLFNEEIIVPSATAPESIAKFFFHKTPCQI